MTRLIDADALPRFGKRGGLIHAGDVDRAPTVDAVPVIRCKDCKHYKDGDCTNTFWGMGESDYCSEGKRRES